MMKFCDKDKECGRGKGRSHSKEGKCRDMESERCDRKEECEKKGNWCDKRDKKCSKMFFKMMMMKEIRIAVEVMWGDLDPVQKDTVCAIIAHKIKCCKDKCKDKFKDKCKEKKECRGKEECYMKEGGEQCKDKYKGKCEGKFGKEKCKDKCKFKSMIKCVTKKLLECKENVLKNIEIAFNAFKEVSERDHPHPMPPHKFGKLMAKLTGKLHKKKYGHEKPEDYAKHFWYKKVYKLFKKLREKAKKIVKSVVFYSCDECSGNEAPKKAVIKSLAEIASGMVVTKMMKKCKEGEEKKEGGEGPHGPPPFGHPSFGPMGHMPFGHGMKMMFKMKLMKMVTKIASKFIGPCKEVVKACIEPTIAAVDEYTKNHKVCCPEKFKKKAMEKILRIIIKLSLEGKKDDAFYKDAIKRVLEGKLTPCDKKCFKSCKKLAKCVLMVEGVNDKIKRDLAMDLGTTRCCQINAKEGCAKEVCIEFLKNWMKNGMKIVEDAKKVEDEVKKECCAKCKKLGIPAVIICEMLEKSLKYYIEMHTIDNKFNAEDCKKKLKEECEGFIDLIEKHKDMLCCKDTK
jgi:hypothetical protein